MKKKERKWRGSECFGMPLYLNLFLQGWAWSEIEAELPGAEETFESSVATQEDPGR